jgi:hypothetical protein
MLEQPKIYLTLLHICEFVAAFVAVLKYNSVKNSYWKWFVFYLIYIFCYEMISYLTINYFNFKLDFYFGKIQVPIEFLILFWLFALKSLANKKLFIVCSSIYLFSLIPDESILKSNYFSSFNYIVGALILLVLVILEFNKQIKDENIINFKENKMFYITIGVILMYIGTLPFFGLYYPIIKVPSIWNNYYKYFMISNCFMYLLFAASFIWGKVK